jgi:ParB family chromosome partitioning protein
MGHARAIINVPEEQAQLVILKKILERKSSVREVEEMVRNHGKQKPAPKINTMLPVKYEKAKSSLRDKLLSNIELKLNRNGAGTITIEFKSSDDFDRIISKLDS